MKMKVATRNKLLTKLVTSKWGDNPNTIRTTALALSYSTSEYAVWARSAHAKNLGPELNQAYWSVTGCLKPTNVEDLYLLSGMRTGYTCSKALMKKWKFYIGDTTCACGKAEDTTAHMLQCSQLAHPCSLGDLIMFNDVGKQCTELWKRMV